MAGVNPYINAPETQLPQQKYTIRFMPMNLEVEVDPTTLEEPEAGLPGSLLAIALANGIEVDHSCGGVCACSTCHVHVKQGGDSCPEATEDEEDMLDMAPSLNATSRLACQCVPNGSMNVVVEVPDWNRNQVKENH